jgi:hypothetical protein
MYIIQVGGPDEYLESERKKKIKQKKRKKMRKKNRSV